MARTPRSADGSFTPSWSSTRVPRAARIWRDGWDLGDACPPDPKANARPGRGPEWREAGAAGGERWRELHERRRRVIRTLRRSGYVARNRWSREDNGTRKHGVHEVISTVYSEGPAKGREAVDPWTTAHKLSFCCSAWPLSPRQLGGGGITVLPVPHGCGLSHVCPVCAAGAASARARALRSVLGHLHDEEPAGLALVTLTQRAADGEPLIAALDRLRDGWRRMTRGRPGKRFREVAEGWYYGDEAPRGWRGKRKGKGGTPRPTSERHEHWHTHRHVALRLRPGVSHEQAAEVIGELWRAASAAAAEAAGRPGYGWEPYAGGCRLDGAGNVTRWLPIKGTAASWWLEVDPEDQAEVYQACKYPAPSADLRPVALAEFLAAAHGRRWHNGGGSLRCVVKLAAELEADGYLPDELAEAEADEAEPLDLGKNIGRLIPGEVPTLRDVAPDLGLPGQQLGLPRVDRAVWTLSRGVDVRELIPALLDAGGDWWSVADEAEPGGVVWRISLPAPWAAQAAADLTAQLQARRKKAEAAAAEVRERVRERRERRRR